MKLSATLKQQYVYQIHLIPTNINRFPNVLVDPRQANPPGAGPIPRIHSPDSHGRADVPEARALEAALSVRHGSHRLDDREEALRGRGDPHDLQDQPAEYLPHVRRHQEGQLSDGHGAHTARTHDFHSRPDDPHESLAARAVLLGGRGKGQNPTGRVVRSPQSERERSAGDDGAARGVSRRWNGTFSTLLIYSFVYLFTKV